MNKEEKEKDYIYDEEEYPKVRRVDAEESKRQGRMVFVTKDREEIIYNDEAYETEDELNSKAGKITIFIWLQLFFFPIIGCIASFIMTSGADKASFGFYIALSAIYLFCLIMSSKYAFDEYTFGTFFKRCARICGGQSIVLILFMSLFLIYPMITNNTYPESEIMRITVLYSLVYAIDILIQIILTYIMDKDENKEKICSIIMLIMQSVAIWVYALIIVPFILKEKQERLIAYGIVLAFSIIMGIINFIIDKKFRKNKVKGPKVVIINSKEDTNPNKLTNKQILAIVLALVFIVAFTFIGSLIALKI